MERKINLLKANAILLDIRLRQEIKSNSFNRLRAAGTRLDADGIDNLVEEEVEIAKNLVQSCNLDLSEHFARNLAEKIEVEKQKQDETFNLLKTEFYESQERYQAGAMGITRVLEKRAQNQLTKSFGAIEEKLHSKSASNKYSGSFLIASLEKLLKNSLFTVFHHLRETAGIKSKADKVNFTLKQKAKILTLAIKEYPHLNMKKAFWKWNFNSRPGEERIKEAVDKLVLYTNINKETAAYRLFRITKEDTKAIKVDIRTKRLGLVLFCFTKIAAMRRIRSSF